MTPIEITGFIEKVYEVLIEEGQEDERFGWGDIIKYRPSEVRDILYKHRRAFDEFETEEESENES